MGRAWRLIAGGGLEVMLDVSIWKQAKERVVRKSCFRYSSTAGVLDLMTSSRYCWRLFFLMSATTSLKAFFVMPRWRYFGTTPVPQSYRVGLPFQLRRPFSTKPTKFSPSKAPMDNSGV